MPSTARKHFDEDLARARSLLETAGTTGLDASLVEDLARSSVVFSVGAMDAYLCDAYVDCLTAAFKACRNDSNLELPSAYAKVELPAGPLLSTHYTSRTNWSLRMAARKKMERDNMLSASRIKDMFNPSLPNGEKLWSDIIDDFAKLNRLRLVGFSRTDFFASTNQSETRRKATAALLKRIAEIVQRRHDIVHNCDRPKEAIQKLTNAAAKKMVLDIEAFVTMFDDHLDDHRIF